MKSKGNHFNVAIYSRTFGSSRGKDKQAKKDAATRRPQGYVIHSPSAYQSGEILYHEGSRIAWAKREDVRHTEIMAPEGSPEWAKHRQSLCDKIEQSEKRHDAQLARIGIASLPRGLTLEQNIELFRDFAKENFVSHGMIVDFAIHESEASDGGKNPHVHFLLTLRDIAGEEGFGNKNRDWNKYAEDEQKKWKAYSVSPWREAWQETTNRHLENAGRTERVSLESFAEQGIDKIPERHLGYHQSNKEKQGIATEKGDHNRWVRHENRAKEAVNEWSYETSKNQSRKGKRKQTSKPERNQSLGDVAKELLPAENGDPRTKAGDEQKRFEAEVKAALHTGKALDKRTRNAMRHSREQDDKEKQLVAARSRHSLLKSSKELSDDLKEREPEYER